MANRSTQPTDVALFMPTLIGGGAERIQLVLAAYFLAQGLRVDLVVCKQVGALRDSVPAGVRLVNLDGKRVLLSLGRYVGYLKAARPRVVISSVENASVIACLGRARGIHPHRLIVRQDNALVAAPTLVGEPRRWASLLVLAVAYRFADHVIAVSHGVEVQLKRLLGRSETSVSCIYNPVITPDFDARSLADPDPSWTRPEIRLVVAAGRLHPVKDYPTLLRAFALVRQRMAASLVIMGEGEVRVELEALAAELGLARDVQFMGFVPNPLPIIRRADVFVLSSLSEGLGGVLVEALALDTPVVSTDCRHGPREVLGDGRFGRLVPVGDAVALAAAIGATLDAPNMPPRTDLRDHLTRYDIDHVGQTYMALLSGPATMAAETETAAKRQRSKQILERNHGRETVVRSERDGQGIAEDDRIDTLSPS